MHKCWIYKCEFENTQTVFLLFLLFRRCIFVWLDIKKKQKLKYAQNVSETRNGNERDERAHHKLDTTTKINNMVARTRSVQIIWHTVFGMTFFGNNFSMVFDLRQSTYSNTSFNKLKNRSSKSEIMPPPNNSTLNRAIINAFVFFFRILSISNGIHVLFDHAWSFSISTKAKLKAKETSRICIYN